MLSYKGHVWFNMQLDNAITDSALLQRAWMEELRDLAAQLKVALPAGDATICDPDMQFMV
jgi:hypothetical protein